MARSGYKTIIWTFVKAVILFGVVVFVFSSFGGFSDSQSLLLALVVATLYGHLKDQRMVEKFEPFYITIMPNWDAILTDYGLATAKEWAALQEKIYADTSEKYHVLKYGITFTVLKPNSEYSQELVFLNHRNRFSSEVDFEEKIQELTQKSPKGLGLSYTPDFRVKWGVTGYKLGISTQESFEKVHMVGDDNEFIELAELPYQLFWPWYVQDKSKPDYAKIEQKLKEKGWQRNKVNEDYKADVLFSVPEQIEHKYFTVYYDSI